MSCRSESDEYKSALTYRFTNMSRSTLGLILENLKSLGRLRTTLAKRKPTLTKDGLTYLGDSKPFDIHNIEVLKHQPLPDPRTQLRYLYLLPKTHNIDLYGQTVVRCELLSDVEEQPPRYIGLSYTWGDPQTRRPILVGDKIFWATENLAIALEHLQEGGKTIVFWIDAICIDQTNLNEKSIQVQRMGNIFASAALVIAWLGPAGDDSDSALQALKKLDEELPDAITELKHTYSERYALLPFASIKALLARQYFKRVWVGQEVALNRNAIFVCGQCDIGREDLLNGYVKLHDIMVMWENTKLTFSYLRFLPTPVLPLRAFLDEENSYFHLFSGSDLESSDPRDFIYSSLGRISDVADWEIRVDYQKSVEEVYTEFAEAVIQTGRIAWMSLCWRASANYGDLPSWVPDWSNTELCRDPCDMEVLKYNIVELCDIDRGGKALKISARRITEISRINCSLQSQQETSAFDISASAIATQQDEERVMSSLDTVRQALDDKDIWSHEDAERAVFDL